MTTTTADKGEQECREAFEKWAITQEWIAPVKNHEPFSRECYPDGDYDITAVRAAWAAWNRRPTNEGESILPLTESKTQTIIRKGYKITGYVLTHDDGRKAISDMQAVRWLEQGEFWKVMHPANEGQDGLPRSNSEEARAGIEAVFKERNWPVNPNAAARCGWEAAYRHLSSKLADQFRDATQMVKADAVKMPETIYVAFADNGNIRFWTADEARAHAFMQDSGIYCAEFTANTAKYQKDQV